MLDRNRLSFTVALAALTLAFVAMDFGKQGLSDTLMRNSRGRNTNQIETSASCNTYNGFASSCVGKDDGTACNACSASNNVNFIEAGDASPGYRYEGTQGVSCGNIKSGSCLDQLCNANNNTQFPCEAPAEEPTEQD